MVGNEFILQQNTSKARQAAKKFGIEIDKPQPHAKMIEREATDAY